MRRRFAGTKKQFLLESVADERAAVKRIHIRSLWEKLWICQVQERAGVKELSRRPL